jgi:DNA-binding MarR family transcriptional regulator
MDSILFALRRAEKIATAHFASKYGKLTLRQYMLLKAVATLPGETGTQTDIVDASGIDRSTASEMISRLVGAHLLARKRGREDARANTVKLTARGRKALGEAEPHARATEKHVIQTMIPALLAFTGTSHRNARAGKAEIAEAA